MASSANAHPDRGGRFFMLDKKVKTVLMDAADIERALTRMADEIIERNKGTAGLALVGVKTRGEHLARRLAKKISEFEKLPAPLPFGALDITLYRDDAAERPPRPSSTTEIPFAIDGVGVVLVDDVLFTGRPVRAAMTALFAYRRPAPIHFASLF